MSSVQIFFLKYGTCIDLLKGHVLCGDADGNQQDILSLWSGNTTSNFLMWVYILIVYTHYEYEEHRDQTDNYTTL